jgi:proliferating cell nuclear antigen
MNIAINDLAKADTFASIFQHIKLMTETINILFENERMYVQSIDSSRISIIEIELPNTWFSEYTKTTPSTITLGIRVSVLYKILNSREKMQNININYEENSDVLDIHFFSESKMEFDKRFEIPLIDIDYELMEIPEIDYSAEFTLDSGNFANLINQLKIFGDTMDITCSEEHIILYSNSQDNGKMSAEIKIDDLDMFSINEGDVLNLSFSLNHLHNICLYNKISKHIEIKLCNEYPMKVLYILSGCENSKMTFYLAPKILDD